jgi:hypothetical protein
MTRRALAAMVLAGLGLAGCAYDGSVKAPGDPRAFDAVAVLAEVTAFAGPGARLVSIEAEYVRSDGTVDTRASYVDRSATFVTYRFIAPYAGPPPPPRDKSVPLGAGPPPATTPEYVGVEVEIVRPHLVHSVHISGGSTSESTDKHRGMRRTDGFWVDTTPRPVKRDRGLDGRFDFDFDEYYEREITLDSVVPPPSCSFDMLWSQAIAHGVPADAVATIRYDRRGYELEIRHTEHALRFDDACRPQPRDA